MSQSSEYARKRNSEEFIEMTNRMQLRGTIYCPLIALHVSSDIIAHHQELPNCVFKASGDTYVRQLLPVS